MMKKYYLAFVMSVLAIAAQAEKIDSSQFVAFYNYVIQTQDEEGQDVADSLRLALMVGTRATECTTFLSYNRDGRASREMMNAFIMHLPVVITDMDKSEVISHDNIYPYRYEVYEPMAKVDWALDDDTLTVCGLLCHGAKGKLYGKQWRVWYCEDIPASAGPWKLRGLPGLIVKAEDIEGIHCFELYETKNEVRAINRYSSPDYQKLSRKKMVSFKNKVLGNPRYAKEPTYYVSEQPDDFGEMNVNGVIYYSANHMLIPQKAHVYQPLELE